MNTYIKRWLCLAAAGAAIYLAPMTAASASGGAIDETNLTLEEAIGMALQSNRAIEQAADDREAAKWELSEARRNFGPKFTWQMSGMRIGGRSYDSARQNHDLYGTPPYDSEFTNQFQASLPVYSGGKLENRKKAAEAGLYGADLTAENTAETVAYRTKAAYYRVIQCQNLITAHEEAVRNLEEHLNVVRTQYEIGTVARSDLLASEVQLSSEEQALTSAQGDLKNAMAQLDNLIGLPAYTQLRLTDICETSSDMAELSACMEYAYQNRPDYLAALYNLRRAEALKEAAKAGYRPTAGLAVTKNIQGEGATFRQDHGGTWSAGVQMEWDVFDNGITAAQVKEAEAARKKAESQAKEAREAVELSVVTAWTNLMTARQNILTAKTAAEKAEADFVIARVRYEEGVDTNLSVMDAQEKLTGAQTNYYNAIAAEATSRAELDKAMGVPTVFRAKDYHASANRGESADTALKRAAIDK